MCKVLNIFLKTHDLHVCSMLETEGELQLKDHLIDDLDFILLPEDGWEFLVQIYGTLDSLKVNL